MPLPLLIPFAVAAASTISTSALVGSIAGSLFGGAALGGGSVYLLTSQSQSNPFDFLDDISRNPIAQEFTKRLDEIDKVFNSVPPALTQVATQVAAASSATATAAPKVEKAAKKIKEVNAQLVTQTQEIKKVTENLVSITPELKENVHELKSLAQKA